MKQLIKDILLLLAAICLLAIGVIGLVTWMSVVGVIVAAAIFAGVVLKIVVG